MAPETRYAQASDGVSIAYQVVGDGPRDLVWVPGWVSHLEAAWEEPTLARFFDRLASFSRLILFDKRGTGLSDRVPESELPTLETRMGDVRTVCEAAGSTEVALLGVSEERLCACCSLPRTPSERQRSYCSAGTRNGFRRPTTRGGLSRRRTRHPSTRWLADGAAPSAWRLVLRASSTTTASARTGRDTSGSEPARVLSWLSLG